MKVLTYFGDVKQLIQKVCQCQRTSTTVTPADSQVVVIVLSLHVPDHDQDELVPVLQAKVVYF